MQKVYLYAIIQKGGDRMPLSTYAEYYDNRLSYNHRRIINTESYRFEPQTHDAFEIIYVKEGNITYRIDEKTFSVKNNSLILTRPGKMHLMDFVTNSAYDRYDIIFDGKIIFKEIYSSLPDELHVIDCDSIPLISGIFEKMDFYCNNFSSEALGNILVHLTEEIFYNIVLKSQTAKPLKYTINTQFANLLEYIDSHFCEPITLETICKELYISKSNLHKIFAHHLNITPKKYICSKRLSLAQKLLQQGVSATNIYEKCGFSDYSSFYRSYKKGFGYPPSIENTKPTIRAISY